MPTARARTHHIVTSSAVVVMAILGVTLTACGSSDDPDEGTTSSISPSAQATASSADPNAAWHTAADKGGQFLVPPEWSVKELATGVALNAPPQREGGIQVGRGILTSSATLESATAIDDAAESRIADNKGAGYDKVERLPDVKFGGLTFYHVRCEDPETWLDDYGTVSDGQRVSVGWFFNRKMVDRNETDELINQVMPTFKPTS